MEWDGSQRLEENQANTWGISVLGDACLTSLRWNVQAKGWEDLCKEREFWRIPVAKRGFSARSDESVCGWTRAVAMDADEWLRECTFWSATY